MFNIGVVGLILLVGCGTPVYSDQERPKPPKELIQYIQDAGRLGLSERQIQEYAIKAGWPAALVAESITQARNSRPTPDAVATTNPPPTAVAANTATQSPTADSQQQAQNAVPAAADSAQPPTSEDYHIGAGDVLQISVWKEPEASVPNAVVRPDGKIGLPLLKEIEVIGLTPTQAEKMITARLEKLIPAADVTVVVTGINSKKIYIVGAVKKEGPIPYTYRMTVMQAISEAGGLNDYAKRKKIYILRTENGKDYKLPFDYEAALKGERMELNIPLLPGDTLVVPH
jgi:polysaccharide export outer membrane protein